MFCYNINNCKQFGKEICNESCPMRLQLQELYRQSNIPKIFLEKEIKLAITKIDQEAFLKLSEYENNIVKNVNIGKGLLIFSGNTGNGKTSWAIRILKTYFKKIALKNDLRCRGLFINVPDFFDLLKDEMNDDIDLRELKYNLENADLVIWDDIGCQKENEWTKEKLYVLINRRILNGKTNIYTTNVKLNELEENIGKRTFSRIMGECGENIIEFKGRDWRVNA